MKTYPAMFRRLAFALAWLCAVGAGAQTDSTLFAPPAPAPSATAPAAIPTPAETSDSASDASGSRQPPLPVTSASYVLRENDVINVSVYQEPDLEAQGQIDNDGIVVLPLLDKVKVAGMSVREAEDFLEKQFVTGKLLIDPQVTVTVLQYVSKTFQVNGEVRAPGIKQFPPDKTEMDVLDAIAMAGSFSDFANTSNITIIRMGPDGHEQSLRMDLRGFISGGKARTEEEMKSYLIYPGDRIFVRGRLF